MGMTAMIVMVVRMIVRVMRVRSLVMHSDVASVRMRGRHMFMSVMGMLVMGMLMICMLMICMLMVRMIVTVMRVHVGGVIARGMGVRRAGVFYRTVMHISVLMLMGGMPMGVLRVAVGLPGAPVAQGADEAPALHPGETGAEQRDQPVTDDLDHANRVVHRLCGRIQSDRRDADHRDRDQRLQQRRGERERDASPPGFFIGKQVGRDHRLAVARSRSVKDAVQKRQAEQAPNGRAVDLGGADEAGHRAVEFGLLGEQPADHAADLGRWRDGPRSAKGRGLRKRAVERARPCEEDKRGSQGNERKHERSPVSPPGGEANEAAHHGHFTETLLANMAP
jgi:hypothetical protein